MKQLSIKFEIGQKVYYPKIERNQALYVVACNIVTGIITREKSINYEMEYGKLVFGEGDIFETIEEAEKKAIALAITNKMTKKDEDDDDDDEEEDDDDDWQDDDDSTTKS